VGVGGADADGRVPGDALADAVGGVDAWIAGWEGTVAGASAPVLHSWIAFPTGLARVLPSGLNATARFYRAAS